MRAASDEENENSFAFCCHEVYKEREVNGKWQKIFDNKLGEMHFTSKKWNLEYVSHEVEHAKTHACRLFDLNHINNEEHEERVAYMTGELVSRTYEWLLKAEAAR